MGWTDGWMDGSIEKKNYTLPIPVLLWITIHCLDRWEKKSNKNMGKIRPKKYWMKKNWKSFINIISLFCNVFHQQLLWFSACPTKCIKWNVFMFIIIIIIILLIINIIIIIIMVFLLFCNKNNRPCIASLSIGPKVEKCLEPMLLAVLLSLTFTHPKKPPCLNTGGLFSSQRIVGIKC